MKKWLSLAFFLICAHSHAAKWVLIDERPGIRTFILTEPAGETANVKKAWLLLSFGKNRVNDTPFTAQKILFEYRCAEKEVKKLSAFLCEDPFCEGKQTEDEVRPSGLFLPIPRESVHDDILQRICASGS